MKDNLDGKGHLNGHSKKPLLKVMREKCLDCCAQQSSEVRLCAVKSCPLWPYRMGKDPFRKRTMTDEQKQAAAKRLK
ncbi:MAG: hypothetical protein GC137_10430 [Alphaproteobacteria bacterium]|nr:hypothetical protein [Alphaproteobacteria bacterium]